MLTGYIETPCEVILVGFIALVIYATASDIVRNIGGIENIRILGGGSLLFGIVKIPFCLFGFVQVLRGIYSVMGKDSKDIEESCDNFKKHQFAIITYLIVSILSYIFLCQYIARI